MTSEHLCVHRVVGLRRGGWGGGGGGELFLEVS